MYTGPLEAGKKYKHNHRKIEVLLDKAVYNSMFKRSYVVLTPLLTDGIMYSLNHEGKSVIPAGTFRVLFHPVEKEQEEEIV